GTRIGLFLQRDSNATNVGPDGLYEIGCSGNILKMLRFPDGTVRFLVQGLARVRVKEYTEFEPYLTATIEEIPEKSSSSVRQEAFQRNLLEQVKVLVDLAPYLNEELYISAINQETPSKLADLVGSNLNIPVEDKQKLLELVNPTARMEFLLSVVNKEIEVLDLSRKIQSKASEELGKTQRDYILREQIKAIRRELGDLDERAEIEELEKKIESVGMNEQAEKVAKKELERFSRMNPSSAEYTVSRTYLDWLVELPWQISSKDTLDLRKAKQTLDRDHDGLEKVKERILEFLAVRKLKPNQKGPILCLVGPPGVGKTSLGRSIASAMGRKFARLSLGGMHDEAEIRGHRRTYIGSMPGRIIQEIKRAGTNNPLIILDEIDKIGTDFRGDPSSALLEVLDPEQNNSFSDHYLDVPFDLSKVMFITTANVLDTVPSALRDRMEVIRLSGYTVQEKLVIAKNHIVLKQVKENGLTASNIRFTDGALRYMIQSYTLEAGLRNIEREIASICRKVARKVAGGSKKKVVIDEKLVEKYLGPPKKIQECVSATSLVGVVTGLAWTSVGGETLFIEAISMPGKNKFTLTGQLGDVMQESAQAALSYVRTHADELKISQDAWEKHDLHIHVPAGATPKDGPSAGVAMATALASLFTGRPVKARLAMTGELTLRGEVLAIGGVKEKLLAAYRAGVNTVILPEANRKDVRDVPSEIRKHLKLVFCDSVLEVVKKALEPLDSDKKPAKQKTKQKAPKESSKKSAKGKVQTKLTVKQKPSSGSKIKRAAKRL
ncbi:endopeptidase La, partial [bacterium AH-315-J21]|nr:endopeptidase La [bacterium AH-315-J21]